MTHFPFTVLSLAMTHFAHLVLTHFYGSPVLFGSLASLGSPNIFGAH